MPFDLKAEFSPVSFFDEAKRITAADYVPDVSDVLRARTKTTGIYETRFTMGQLSIQYVAAVLDTHDLGYV
jgi:hypothetical protein